MLPIGQAISQHQQLQEARMMTVPVPLAATGAPLSYALPLLRFIRLRDPGI